MRQERSKKNVKFRLPGRRLFLSSDNKSRKISTKILKAMPLIAVFVFGFVLTFASVREKQRPNTPSMAESDNTYILVSSKQVNAIIDAPTSAEGIVSAAKQTVVVKTNSSSGYNLYIAGARRIDTEHNDDHNDSTLMFGENAAIDNFNRWSNVIKSGTGTKQSPQELLAGQWGYALKRDQNNENSLQFSEDYAAANLKNTKWAKIPSYDKPDLIKSKTTPSGNGGDEIDIFYGINADNSLPSMTFEGYLVYTALTNQSVQSNTIDATIFPKKIGLNGKSRQAIKIETNIAADDSTAPETFSLDGTIKIGGKECTGGKIVSTKVQIECYSPELANGVYDVKIELKGLNKTYTIPQAIEYTDQTVGFPDSLQYMQDMTRETCWKATTPTRDLNENEIPKKELIDRRDGKRYLVVKMPDENCWMAKNLDLKLTAGQQLTPDDTDIEKNLTIAKSTQTGTITSWSGKYNSYRLNDSLGILYDWWIATVNDKPHYFVNTSICPKGWTLPTSKREFSKYDIDNLAGNTIVGHRKTIEALKLKPTGYIENGILKFNQLAYMTTKDLYDEWDGAGHKDTLSASAIKSDVNDGLEAHDEVDFNDGLSVRCVAR